MFEVNLQVSHLTVIPIVLGDYVHHEDPETDRQLFHLPCANDC